MVIVKASSNPLDVQIYSFVKFVFRSSQASYTIRQRVGKLLAVSNATRWNSVYDALAILFRAYDQNQSGFQNACREFQTRCFTSIELSCLYDYRLKLLHKMLNSTFRFYKITESVKKLFLSMLKSGWFYFEKSFNT